MTVFDKKIIFMTKFLMNFGSVLVKHTESKHVQNFLFEVRKGFSLIYSFNNSREKLLKLEESDLIWFLAALGQLSEDEIAALQAEMSEKKEVQVAGFTLVEAQLKFQSKLQKLHTISYVPSVIEPSFGIGKFIQFLPFSKSQRQWSDPLRKDLQGQHQNRKRPVYHFRADSVA